MSSNSLLDDLQGERYDHALQSGNLIRPPKEAPEKFFLTEYRATLADELCACGAKHRRLVQIMACEKGSKGSSIARALHLNPALIFQADIPKTVSYMHSTISHCAECIFPIHRF